MRTLTVFVVGGGARDSAIRGLAESWTRAGILEPSLWVTPGDVVVHPAGPPSVQAWAVDADGVRGVDLFEHVGRFRLDLVRVVVGHLLLLEDASDLSLAATGSAVADAIESTLPRRTDHHEAGCRMHRSVVVLPVSGATGADPSLFQPQWDVNAVISPEDRPDLDRASVFVRYPGNLDGHATAALAAIGGILRGVPAGVLDEATSDSTTREADAVVARISIRSVVGEDMLDRLVGEALDPARLGPVGPAPVLAWARPASRPDLIADQAATHILQSPEWAPTSEQVPQGPPERHHGFWSALGTAAGFNVRTVGAVASWVFDRARGRVETRATEAVVGAQNGILVTLGPKPVDDLAQASTRLLERERARIDANTRFESTRTVAPVPSTWARPRALLLGLVDGGDLDGFPEPRQAGRRELLPPGSVVVPPGAQWEGSDGERVLAEDPLAMRAYRTELEAKLAKAKAAAEKAAAELAAAEDARAESEKVREAARVAAVAAAKSARARSRGKAASADDPAAEQASPAKAALPPLVPDDATLAGLLSKRDRRRAAVTALTLETELYGAWYSEMSGAVLWKVGDDVAQRRVRLQSRLDALAARKPSTPPAEALSRAKAAVTRWWLWTVPIWAVATAAVVWLRYGSWPQFVADADLAMDDMLYICGILLATALVLLAAANHRFYKAVLTYEWAVERELTQLHRDHAELMFVGTELARLQLLDTVLRDWVRILGEAIHRPWASPDREFEDLPEDVVAALPASMGVARQTMGEDAIPMATLMSAYRVLYPEHWATRSFDRAYEAFEESEPTGPNEGYRSADLDALDGPVSPRKRLREFWSSGEARAVLTDRAHADLHRAVRDGDLELPTRVVGRIGRYADGETGPEPEFFRATATESTMFSTDAFTAAGRQSRRHYVERSIAWIPTSARAAVSSDDGVQLHDCEGPNAVRVDVSRRTPAHDLSMFTAEAPPQEPGVEVPDRVVVESGLEDIAWH